METNIYIYIYICRERDDKLRGHRGRREQERDVRVSGEFLDALRDIGGRV